MQFFSEREDGLCRAVNQGYRAEYEDDNVDDLGLLIFVGDSNQLVVQACRDDKRNGDASECAREGQELIEAVEYSKSDDAGEGDDQSA